MLRFKEYKFLQCDRLIFMFGLGEKHSYDNIIDTLVFFLTGLQHIIKCLGLSQRNCKQDKRFPLCDPVSLSQGRRLSGDPSCVRQSCYIGNNAQQELWNVSCSLRETFYQHADFNTFIILFVFWIKLQVLLTVYLIVNSLNDK